MIHIKIIKERLKEVNGIKKLGAFGYLDSYRVTEHAENRMNGRSISREKINEILQFGRIFHARGASIYVVGKKEVRMYKGMGLDLRHVEGIQVVTAQKEEEVIVLTAYRNHDFSKIRKYKAHSKRR